MRQSIHFLRVFVFIVTIALLQVSHADNALSRKIQSLINDTGEDLNIGIYMEEIGTGYVKFAYHKNRRFVPASTTKVYTVYAALEKLGPHFQFKTTISSDGHIDKEAGLNGNLYIKFSGDPTLTYENLKKIIKGVSVSKINGNFIIDDELFDHYPTGPGGITWDDVPFYYAAPVSAAVIDDNTTEAKMWPSKKVGRLSNVSINRPYVLGMKNKVSTVHPRRSECPYRSKYIGNNQYEVYGCMFNNAKSIRLNFALPDNRLMVRNYIKQALKDLGIVLNGEITFAKSRSTRLLYTHQSPYLKDIVKPLLYHSMNVGSASLFKYMGHLYTRGKGSDEAGEVMMRRFLKKKNITRVIVKEGAGSSRYNLLSPKGLVSLLQSAYYSKSRDYFLNALPSYGDNSTLKYRSISSKYDKYVFAKSGGMRNISSLTGYYLPTGDKKKYVFAIMINNHNLSVQQVKGLEDKILYALLSN